MTAGLSVRALLVVLPLAAAGVGGAVAGLGGRDPDDAFLARQENPARVTAAAVEELMLTAPDPAPPHRASALRASCRPLGTRELRNPWRCTVRYPPGKTVRFETTIAQDGSYVAGYLDDPGQATARGCCLSVPGAD